MLSKVAGCRTEWMGTWCRRLRSQRTSDAPFDVVKTGITPGDDAGRAQETIGRYREAGVTWWLEAIAPYRVGKSFQEPWDLDGLRERVLQGPPRG